MTSRSPATDPFSLAGLVRTHAMRRPSRPALSEGDRTLSFAELDRRSSQVAHGLRSCGVEPGDRVAVLARNCMAYYEVMLGVAKAGAIMVGINFRLAAGEIREVMADARPRVLFVGTDVVAAGAGLALAGSVGALPTTVNFGVPYEQWLEGHAPIDPLAQSPEDVVLQLYSSGTTGVPKGAMITNANLSWTALMGRDFYRMGQDTVNLLTSPMFHIGGAGYSLTAFGNGGHSVLAPSLEPSTVLSLLQAHRVTHAFLVPTIIRSLLDALGTHPVDLSSLQLVAYGASPIDQQTLAEAIDAMGCQFLGVYGMTETAGSVTALLPEEHHPSGRDAHLLRSVGRALPWHEVAVFDPDAERQVAPGVVGEIWVRSPQNMVGYWHRPDLNAVTLREDGWLRTGDAAWCDEDGYIYIHDRLKDMVISGGENIYPAEVERVLIEHPGVREVVVVGVPHERWGETVKAIVVANAGAQVSEGDLIAFCRERIAHFKCPTSVDFVEELVRNASGKVLKRVMREAYWPGGAQEVGGRVENRAQGVPGDEPARRTTVVPDMASDQRRRGAAT